LDDENGLISLNRTQTFNRARCCIWAWRVQTLVPRMRNMEEIWRKAAIDVQKTIVRPCPWTVKI